MKFIDHLQGLGRALMLPIAVLPVAGLLLRLGQDDVAGPVARVLPLVHLSFLASAGGAIFDNLGLLFAIGAAVGLARENHGAAGLAGVVCFLVATTGAGAVLQVHPDIPAGLAPPLADLVMADARSRAIHDLSVPIGILSGVLAGLCYNRYSGIRLPEYLAFFAGRRFVPILMGLVGAVIALVVGQGYEALHAGLIATGRRVVEAGDGGLFLYGVLNRLLIVTGLHHILNNIAWFIIGDFHGATGDLKRFFAGDPTAGVFMAGFFPVMMFGLPAACLAMYHAADRARRPEVGGMLASMALTSFLTGVTEPVEFTFMFLAPALYGLHMLLTGAAFVIMNLLGVKLGFSFSAGLFDYLINFRLASRRLLLLPVGLAYFALYYGLFRAGIRLLNLKTPGRGEAGPEAAAAPTPTAPSDRAAAFLAALGGAANLVTLDACTTRLRLTVRDQGAVDEATLRRLGARGIVRPSDTAVQVVLGPLADLIAGEIREVLSGPAPSAAAGALLVALGGAANIAEATAVSTRVLVTLRRPVALAEDQAPALGLRALARPSALTVHLVAGEAAAGLARALSAPWTSGS